MRKVVGDDDSKLVPLSDAPAIEPTNITMSSGNPRAMALRSLAVIIITLDVVLLAVPERHLQPAHRTAIRGARETMLLISVDPDLVAGVVHRPRCRAQPAAWRPAEGELTGDLPLLLADDTDLLLKYRWHLRGGNVVTASRR